MEREVQREPEVLERDDKITREPPDRAEYTPGTLAASRLARGAIWIALIAVLAVALVILIYALVA